VSLIDWFSERPLWQVVAFSLVVLFLLLAAGDHAYDVYIWFS
jgi:hypothetical protein